MDLKTQDVELTQVAPAKGSRNVSEDISQREYEDRVQLMRLGKKSVLKVRLLFQLCHLIPTFRILLYTNRE